MRGQRSSEEWKSQRQTAVEMQFTRLTPQGLLSWGKGEDYRLYNHACQYGRWQDFSEYRQHLSLTGSRWLKKIYEKPNPGNAIIIELDEMWHYLCSKKNKLWIWKAYRRETGELIDWECGGRKDTFKKLVDQLSKWKVELFCADNPSVYSEVIGEDKLLQSKSQTCYLEQNKGDKDTVRAFSEEI